MVTVKELLENRAVAGREIETMNAEVFNKEGYAPTAEDEQRWAKVNSDFDALDRQLEIARRAELVSDKLSDSPRTPARELADEAAGVTDRQQSMPENEARVLAVQAWCRRGARMDIDEKHELACRQLGVDPELQHMTVPLMRSHEVRALYDSPQTVTTGGGGYTIPVGFVAELENAMKAFGGMRQLARVLRTAEGNQLQWPTVDDTSNTGELVGINLPTTEAPIVFGQKLLDAYKFGSKAVTVPFELLQDSAFDLGTFLATELGTRLGRVTNTFYTTGTGISQPQGIHAATGGAAVGATASSATVLTYDDLINLQMSIDPAYRNNPSVAWTMHDSILAAIRRLQDANANPLWGVHGLTVGEPNILLGKPYIINQDLPSVLAVSQKVIYYGDWSKFVIREVGEIRLVRDVSVRVAFDQTVFIAWLRGDSEYINAGGNPIKHLVMAAV